MCSYGIMVWYIQLEFGYSVVDDECLIHQCALKTDLATLNNLFNMSNCKSKYTFIVRCVVKSLLIYKKKHVSAQGVC